MKSVMRFPGLQSSLILALFLICTTPAEAGFQRVKDHQFELQGLKRTYLSYSPKNAQQLQGKRPLVVVVHGGGGTHRSMIRLTKRRFNQLADQHGFFVVYPNAIDKIWDFGEGTISDNLETRRDDLTYFREVISRMEAAHPIDAERIFVTGISRGGKASYFLACKLPGKIRAIAPFTMPLPDNFEDDCRDGPPVSIALFNGTGDPLVPYDGGMIRIGKHERGEVLSTNQTLALWRARNDCPADDQEVTRIDRVDDNTHVERISWRGCKGGRVVLYRMVNAGHTWPSGPQYLPRRIVGNVTRDIDGAVEAWHFFSQF